MNTLSQEGIDHINAYSKSNLPLGRLLSNFACTPFTCEDGEFQSIEGYWYWLSCTHPRREELRHVYGWKAKQLGRELRGQDWVSTPEFQNKIKRAITKKINEHPKLKKLLVESHLPIVHYYEYGGKRITPEGGQWIWQHIMDLREAYQALTCCPVFHTGNMWDAWDTADLWLFTGNGVVTTSGKLVMGAGIARQVRDKFPGCDAQLGKLVARHPTDPNGNHLYYLLTAKNWRQSKGGIFQTKAHWKEPSTLPLIMKSTATLKLWAIEHPTAQIHLNYPGIGHGGLTPKQVRPILDTLPNNVHIWSYK